MKGEELITETKALNTSLTLIWCKVKLMGCQKNESHYFGPFEEPRSPKQHFDTW